MKSGAMSLILVVTLMILCQRALSATTFGTNSLVVSTTESTKDGNNVSNDIHINPKIYSMEIQTNVSNRFATTLVTSRVRNLKKDAAETTFSVILPENAFVSEFVMEIGGKSYKAYVKEKEEAKKIYQQAVASGRSAGHVELSARDSKTFTVNVNVEPESKTIFHLTYEELLQRELGQYEIIINIHPGQIVDDLSVQVCINESRPLTFVRTPSLRTGNEISKNNEKLDPEADIKVVNETSAIVTFKPNKDQQKNFGDLLGSNKENGLAGQFVVQYDVERDPQGGEVLVRDGYFVHFFSPSELKPLPKHVVFVLDYSGSMMGRKIEQLTEAMQNILSDLNENDFFTIVRFSGGVSVWNVSANNFADVNLGPYNYGHQEPQLREQNLSEGAEASKDNIKKAKDVIKNRGYMGSTNIIGGLEVGLFLVKRTQENFPNKYQPMIIFLTDGFPNEGMHSTDEITDTVTKLNSGTNRASIFSLSFGNGADKKFLQKLSANNLGFSRHIFEAADASLQLQEFYSKISSPLLSNVTFEYVDGVTDVTKTSHPIFFNGSELVVAGKTNDLLDITLSVGGISRTGPISFKPVKEEPVSSIERLWAYLTVKQILKEKETATNTTELTKRALDLALKYSFVTSVSSLVVVKPNQTEGVEDKKGVTPPSTPWARANNIRPLMLSPRSGPGIPSFGGGRHYLSASSPRRAYISHSYSASMLPYRGTTTYGMSSRGALPDSLSVRSFAPGPWYPAVPTTRAPHRQTTLPTIKPESERPQDNLPQWLMDIQSKNENITTPQGSFLLGKSGDVTARPQCPKTPLNNTAGECTILFDCPQVFSLLPDMKVYLEYFCPLDKYAGVCCPKKVSIP